MKHHSFPPLRIGQRIRVTLGKLESGVPTRVARMLFSAKEGVVFGLDAEKNDLKITFMTSDGEASVFVIVTPLGVRLRGDSTVVEIIGQPPVQMALEAV